MRKKNVMDRIITSIFGDEIIPFVSIVTPEGEEKRANVGLDIWSGASECSIILTPKDAKELANRLNAMADKAYEANYNLIIHKAPF